MKLFTNNYNILRQENIDESVKLNAEDYAILDRMLKYLSANNISLFELEVMKKDLIGLAKEAETSGVSLKEFLEQPEKDFCDTLMDGALKKHPWESPLLLLQKLLLVICGYHFLFFVLLGFPEKTGLGLSALLYAAVFVFCQEFVHEKIKGKYMYHRNYKKINVIFYMIFAFLLCWPFGGPNVYLIHGNGWIISLILAVSAILLFFGNNYYWNKQSEKYNWE